MSVIIDPKIIVTVSTAFFDNWPHSTPLPTPSEIRSSTFGSPSQVLSQRKHGAFAQTVLHFPELCLVVKYGPRTTISEGQALQLVREYCPEVPVPEVYGWCQDNGETFMYISYVEGVSLDSRLSSDSISDDELKDVAAQLAPMITALRRLRQPSDATFIGSPDHTPIREQLWWIAGDERPPDLPFLSVQEFNDAFVALAKNLPGYPESQFYSDIRSLLPDSSAISFTHTDLATTNIMVSPPDSGAPTKIVGIIDWQESGWYPEYWEYLKACFTAGKRWFGLIDQAFETKYPSQLDALELLSSTGIFA